MRSFLFLSFYMLSQALYAACSTPAGVAGQMQWISADSKVKYCNGTTWVDTSQGTGASCTGTTPGTIQNSSGIAQYCNGTNWITMSSGTNLGASAADTGTFQYDSGTSTFKFANAGNWFDLSVAVGGADLKWTDGLGNILGTTPMCGAYGSTTYQYLRNFGTTTSSSITLTADDPAAFIIVTTDCTTLIAGDTCIVEVNHQFPSGHLSPFYQGTLTASATNGGTSVLNLQSESPFCSM